MTVYARSDLQTVILPTGCGQPHNRPADDSGQPVTTWELTCPACELMLAADPCFAARKEDVPLTPDEIRKAEESAKARLSGEEGLLGAMANVLAAKYAQPASAVPCSSCTEAMPPASRFCPSCGIPSQAA